MKQKSKIALLLASVLFLNHFAYAFGEPISNNVDSIANFSISGNNIISENLPDPTISNDNIYENVEDTNNTEELASANNVDNGTCGDNLTWQITGDTITISGTGEMYDYSSSPWYGYNIKKAVFNYGITRISNSSFNNTGIVSVSIPESVQTIGSFAFSGCHLTELVIPHGVKTIEDRAFDNNTELETVYISDTVTNISSMHLAGNSIIEDGTGGAFSHTPNIKRIVVDDNNSVYDSRNNCNAIINTRDNSLIKGCGNTVIPDTVKIIGPYAFQVAHPDSNSFWTLVIPDSVEYIGREAFKGSSYQKILLPNNLKEIHAEAFNNTNIESVFIPASVYLISYSGSLSPFCGCYYLKSIVVDEENTVYDSRNDCNALIETSSDRLLQGCPKTTIPSSIKIIEDYAFAYFGNSYSGKIDDEIVIPFGVTKIGYGAFCATHIKKVEIPVTVVKIGNTAFDLCDDLSVYYNGSQDEWLNIDITNLTDSNGLKKANMLYNSSFAQLKYEIRYKEDMSAYKNSISYYLSSEDKEKLKSNTSKYDYFCLMNVFNYTYSKKKGGICHGISNAIVANKIGQFETGKYNSNCINELDFTDNSVQSILTLYQLGQDRGLFITEAASFSRLSLQNKLKKIIYNAQNIGLLGPSVLCYNCNIGAHTVVVDGIEEGEYNIKGALYKYRVKTYDINSFEGVNKEKEEARGTDPNTVNPWNPELFYMYISSNYDSWIIPYSEYMSKPQTGKSGSNNLKLIYNKDTSIDLINHWSHSNTSAASAEISSLIINTVDGLLHIGASTVEIHDGIVSSDDESVFSLNEAFGDDQNVRIVFPSDEKNIGIYSNKPGIDMIYQSSDEYISISADNARSVSINSNSGFKLSDVNGMYSASITKNDDFQKQINFSGSGDGAVSVNTISDNIIIQSDFLQNLSLSIQDWDSSHADMYSAVSSTMWSISLNNAGQDLCVMYDSNGDGECDTIIKPLHIAVEDVSLNCSDISIKKGDNYKLLATISPENATNKNIEWKSNNNDIAQVDQNGIVKGVSIGKTYITATSEDGGKEATCVVRVIEPNNPDISGQTEIEPGDLPDGKSLPEGIWIGGLKKAYYYNGSPIKPEFRVYYNNKRLNPKIDYTTAYKDNTAVGKNAKIVLNFKGDFTGSKTVTFEIAKNPLSANTVSADLLAVPYKAGKKNNKVKPILTNSDGIVLKYSNKDFEFKYLDSSGSESLCEEVGTYSIQMTSKSDSKGYVGGVTVNVPFIVTDKPVMSAVKVTGKTSLPYTGEKQMPSLTLKCAGEALNKNYYAIDTISGDNYTDPGSHMLIFKGDGTNIYGVKRVTYKITGKRKLGDNKYTFVMIAPSSLDGDGKVPYVYGGAKPDVIVSYNGVLLRKGRDYTVGYKNNKKAGNVATVTIKGAGSYTGSIPLNYNVSKQKLSNLTLVISDRVESTKEKDYEKAPILFFDKSYTDQKLRKNTDYTAVFTVSSGSTKPTAGDSVSVNITAKSGGNYTGEVNATYRIIRKSEDIGKAKVTIHKGKSYNYTGKPITPSGNDVVVKIGNTPIGSDNYDLFYSNNIKRGKNATVLLKGKNNYSGQKIVRFSIGGSSLAKLTDLWNGVIQTLKNREKSNKSGYCLIHNHRYYAEQKAIVKSA